jgi:hypothetical protein
MANVYHYGKRGFALVLILTVLVFPAQAAQTTEIAPALPSGIKIPWIPYIVISSTISPPEIHKDVFSRHHEPFSLACPHFSPSNIYVQALESWRWHASTTCGIRDFLRMMQYMLGIPPQDATVILQYDDQEITVKLKKTIHEIPEQQAAKSCVLAASLRPRKFGWNSPYIYKGNVGSLMITASITPYGDDRFVVTEWHVHATEMEDGSYIYTFAPWEMLSCQSFDISISFDDEEIGDPNRESKPPNEHAAVLRNQ